MIDLKLLDEVIEILETPIHRLRDNGPDEDECRACFMHWPTQGPNKTNPRHFDDCLLGRLKAIRDAAQACKGCGMRYDCPSWCPVKYPKAHHHWDGDGREVPCLDPEKMNGYCDQFGGSDY